MRQHLGQFCLVGSLEIPSKQALHSPDPGSPSRCSPILREFEIDLFPAQVGSRTSAPKQRNFLGSARVELSSCFLMLMNPKCPEKSRQMHDIRSGILKSQQQIPVPCKLK